ncbi:nuclear factor of activated T-cells, cytoplasmic 4-like isoform X2 [Acipenser oxyrinchus oxyrinchus]|uniref:Nuclear factor of activated T-cells, cytoplasmic 4-like isoform X2 n=1 Tax=Acipenser oxyrinchus oxyrinchus TaxID=40147 RepID=A0AAD8CJV1_ACIOX|nr:nuclear factor of activated T-cells, cytoplasmic 4-like isoform X2 [Acipenser oxyrinchus oxyrinchus]
MGAAPGWENGELEFKLVFEEDPLPGSGPTGAELERGRSADVNNNRDADQERNPPSLSTNQPIQISQNRPGGGSLLPSTNNRAGMHSPPPKPTVDKDFFGTYESQPARYIQLDSSRILECPSIQITPISPQDSQEETYYCPWERTSRDHLYLPLDPFSYRDGGSLSPSSASSLSSRSWVSDASSCDSLLLGDEEELNEATSQFNLGTRPTSPRLGPLLSSPASPSSRPASPGGKRRHSGCLDSYSPLPSPSISRRGSFSEDPLSPDSSSEVPEFGFPTISGLSVPLELDNIPQKARKTSLEQGARKEDPAGSSDNGYQVIDAEEGYIQGKESYHHALGLQSGMDYLSVPSPLAWSKARMTGHRPIFRSTALPPLDWPLPSQFDPYELRVEVQPRSHHRAHYETEGSRGAVKASPGGNPIVKLLGFSEKPLSLQMFIGSADERALRPHAFYQVHRITGKMVSTASQELVLGGTKILEIPLHPENGMSASIDCAGILKLRNSDIELRKGETDIGRKNTRVRLAFRVHIPQGAGKVVSIQTASVPIECSQRSAQELPAVESCNITSCSLEGGEELVLTGSNFLPESKVIFIEKGPDGKLQWESEAQVDQDKSSESELCVEVPGYCNETASQPVQVYFYVSNGKRKRSSIQCFKYLPVMFKEPPPVPMSNLQCPLVADPSRAAQPCHSLGPEGGQYQVDYHPYYQRGEKPSNHIDYPHGYPSPRHFPLREEFENAADDFLDHLGYEAELGVNGLLLPHLQKPDSTPSLTWLDSPYQPTSPSSLSPYTLNSPVSSSSQSVLCGPSYPSESFEGPSLQMGYAVPQAADQAYAARRMNFRINNSFPVAQEPCLPPYPSYPYTDSSAGLASPSEKPSLPEQTSFGPESLPAPVSQGKEAGEGPQYNVEREEMKSGFEGYGPPFRNVPIQGITLEEVNEFIGENLTQFPDTNLEGRPN